MELPDPPEGWTLYSLHRKDPGELCVGESTWCVYLVGKGEYLYAWGSTPRFAMLDALERIASGDTFERLSGFQRGAPRAQELDLASFLKVPQVQFKRRT